MSFADNRYFMGANTSGGFVSMWDDVINGADRVYIIKSGPGTGKSHFMLDVSSEAENRGMEVEYFLCSSDASSLDGIYIKDMNIAITDGTNPHRLEPELYGINGEIINLGEFTDSRLLEKQAKTISAIIGEKSGRYRRVYSLMRANDELYREERELVASCIDMAKLDNFCERFIRRLSPVTAGAPKIRQTYGVGMEGISRLESYENLSSDVYTVNGIYGEAGIIIERLADKLKKRGTGIFISCDNLENMTPGSVMLAGGSAAIIKNGSVKGGGREINAGRFTDSSALSFYRRRLRKIEKIRNAVKEEILMLMSEIKTLHFEAEDIYSSATDYSRREAFTRRFMIRLFS